MKMQMQLRGERTVFSSSDAGTIGCAYVWKWTSKYTPNLLQKLTQGRVLVAHACNSSYSRGRDQEDHSSKPAWANSSQDPILKKPFTKKGWWSSSRCGPWVQPHYHKKKKPQNGSCTLISNIKLLEEDVGRNLYELELGKKNGVWAGIINRMK
jgi:hypothetical protein